MTLYCIVSFSNKVNAVGDEEEERERTYAMRELSIHTTPSIHPIVTSTRRLFQLKSSSSLIGATATRAVKSMRMPAER